MENLKQEKEKYIHKIFLLCLEMIFIFSVPAVLAAIAGVKVDEILGTGNKITALFLILSFAFSWIWVIIKYIKLNKKLKEINSQIKKAGIQTFKSNK